MKLHELRERMDALEEERDELADSLDLVEDEVKATLEELLSDGQRHAEEVDTQLDILAVEQAEFVRQMDDQNMALEITILELREELQTALSDNAETEDDRGNKPALKTTAAFDQLPKGKPEKPPKPPKPTHL
ncbi:uncharacterized protein J4E87_004132 [Alternaria ethzedia]|uniref:uncharacterized protein n=1 Tax=Alternaria ethzedia TaxID=181014 RepID=UPI0020C58B29|nr:uncharacterized protein J4E87_004132 [Alternaria ethzedia]KAI4627568.1 hypothetical protein J4E87_004132 [Alternaria ethzedia]